MAETTVTPRIFGPSATRFRASRSGQVGRRRHFGMFAVAGLCGRLMVMLPLCWVGCGGDDDPSPSPAAQNQPSAPASDPAPAPSPADSADGTQTPADSPAADPDSVDPADASAQDPTMNPEGNPDGTEDPTEAGPDGTVAETKPQRPADVSKWTRADYFTAKAENDPKFIEAIKLAGVDPHTDSPTAAKMLADLLAPTEPGGDGEDGNTRTTNQPRSDQTSTEVTGAIVAGIVRNKTPEAAKILARLLCGSLPAENDRQTVEAILKTLAADPTTTNNTRLLHILTGAEKFRPAAETEEPSDGTNDATNDTRPSDSIDAEELRRMTFDLVKEDAPALLREGLARHISQPAVSKAQYDLFWDLLKENREENVGAQLCIYRAENTPAEVRLELEEFFVAYSSTALGNLLGIVSNDSDASTGVGETYYDSTSGPKPLSPEMVDGIAGYLWQASFATLIETRLKETESAERPSVLLELARTMPVDSTRIAVSAVLRESWTQGPSQLTEGTSGQLIDDPGFLVAVKSLLIKSPTFRVAGRTGREKLIQVRPEWEQLIEDLTRVWCGRLHAAALARAEAAASTPAPQTDADASTAAAETTPQTTATATAQHPTTQPSTAGEPTTDAEGTAALPIQLHKGAKPTAQYRVRWPDDVKARLPDLGLGSIAIDYIRMEETASPKLRLGYYRRQLRADERDVVRTDTSFRVDSFRSVPGTDRKRFISVLIAQDDQAGTVQGDEDEQSSEIEPLVIEILAIEMADPAAN